jgi:hypothetical protein
VFEALLVAAAISLTDPAGDVVGAGSLRPPSAAVYRNLAPFDLRQVTVADGEQLTVEIEMGSLANPFELPLGFSLPVIELYIEGREGGETELLGGSGMSLPDGRTWEVALRLTGEAAAAYRAGASGLESAVPEVSVEGNVLTVSTAFPRPERPRVYAMVGLYDLFGSSPWRPVDEAESPWAFSSPSQRLPVVDVLARDSGVQAQAIEQRTMPASGGRRLAKGAVWLVLMALGLLVALLGIAMRAFARRFGPSGDMERGQLADEHGGKTDGERAGVSGGPSGGEELADEPPPRAAPTGAGMDPAESPLSPDQGAWGDRPEEGGFDSDGEEPFTWDSSALLTEPHDEEPSEPFPRVEPVDRTAVWARPVPLPIKDETAAEEVDDENHLEVVRDDERSDGASQAAGSPEANGPADTASEGSAGEEPGGRDSAGKDEEGQREGRPGRGRGA